MSTQAVHRFLRNPNYSASIFNRIANRLSPFQNTLTVLDDPKEGKRLFLIGTTNSSNILAQRTKNLIAQEKPDTVLVQTNETWWNLVSQLEGIKSQQDLNVYNNIFSSAQEYDIPNHVRGLIFQARLYPWLLIANAWKNFPTDFHPFIPGLEMKFAIEEAKKIGAHIHFSGLQLNQQTVDALSHEKRMDALPFAWRIYRSTKSRLWSNEDHDQSALLEVLGGEAFAEIVDRNRINWFVKQFERAAPLQKKIIVDQRDHDLFYRVHKRLPGKKIVAVVNQWHVPGIEAHWRHTTGTEVLKAINPVGDMDITGYMERKLVNDALRNFTSKLGATEPATWADYSTIYHKELMEAERVRHVNFLGANDPHLQPDGSIEHKVGPQHH